MPLKHKQILFPLNYYRGFLKCDLSYVSILNYS